MKVLRLWVFALLLACGATAQAAITIQLPDFQRLERELKLKPNQKVQFDAATLSLKRTLLAIGPALLEVKQQLAEELMKDRPDFMGLLQRQRAAYELAAPLFRETYAEWGKLYALLEDDQVVVAKRFLQEAIDSVR